LLAWMGFCHRSVAKSFLCLALNPTTTRKELL
jgi:hypothetical protein